MEAKFAEAKSKQGPLSYFLFQPNPSAAYMCCVRPRAVESMNLEFRMRLGAGSTQTNYFDLFLTDAAWVILWALQSATNKLGKHKETSFSNFMGYSHARVCDLISVCLMLTWCKRFSQPASWGRRPILPKATAAPEKKEKAKRSSARAAKAKAKADASKQPQKSKAKEPKEDSKKGKWK